MGDGENPISEDGDAETRKAAVRGLGRLKDPRAAAPLCELLASGMLTENYRPPRSNEIVESLTRLGPSAEPVVQALLGEKNLETRIQACTVLKQIGTEKSLPALKDLLLNPTKELSDAAAEACRAIQAARE